MSVLYCRQAMIADAYNAIMAAMRTEMLKSTTVRFTESELRLLDSLQEKLGLGMVHIIRLAIRRLAEGENLLPVPSGNRKR